MPEIRNDWSILEIDGLISLPFNDLIFKAQMAHRANFNANEVQLSTLLSIKTGACPEDCSYCPQSGHYQTEVEKERLLDIETVIENAKRAKAQGANRFCLGGAWRSPPKKAMPKLTQMIKEVKALGLETCMTAGMVDEDEAKAFKDAGLDFYNHNLDTSPEYYKKIISTRKYEDRLETLNNVRKAGLSVCCGGIVGLGETRADRVSFLHQLATMAPHPESVPINRLIASKGTPLENQKEVDSFELVRTIATARILMPKSHVRLTAGRETMSDELQALCFLAGANSIFLGAKLLTAKNPEKDKDFALMKKLGLRSETTKTNETILQEETA